VLSHAVDVVAEMLVIDNEKNMGIIASFKAYPKACMWSLIFSTAIIMEGVRLRMAPIPF
jgi:hypothetical protein